MAPRSSTPGTREDPTKSAFGYPGDSRGLKSIQLLVPWGLRTPGGPGLASH